MHVPDKSQETLDTGRMCNDCCHGAAPLTVVCMPVDVDAVLQVMLEPKPRNYFKEKNIVSFLYVEGETYNS